MTEQQNNYDEKAGVGSNLANYLPEAGGVAWTEVRHPSGFKVNLTSRGKTPGDAWNELMKALVEIVEEPITNEFALTHKRAAKVVAQEFEGEDPFSPDVTDKADVQPTQADHFNVVSYMKASDKEPLMKYALEATLFKYDGDRIKFYTEDDKYPRLSHNMKAEYPREIFNEAFNGWEPPIVGERTAIPGGAVILHVQCSDENNLTRDGNPYSNLVGMRRP